MLTAHWPGQTLGRGEQRAEEEIGSQELVSQMGSSERLEYSLPEMRLLFQKGDKICLLDEA